MLFFQQQQNTQQEHPFVGYSVLRVSFFKLLRNSRTPNVLFHPLLMSLDSWPLCLFFWLSLLLLSLWLLLSSNLNGSRRLVVVVVVVRIHPVVRLVHWRRRLRVMTTKNALVHVHHYYFPPPRD